MNTCATCKHMHVSGIEHTCRRYPPTVLVEQSVRDAAGTIYTVEIITSRFPEVNDTDYCSEFSPQ